jgi:iron complex transport system permease protein
MSTMTVNPTLHQRIGLSLGVLALGLIVTCMGVAVGSNGWSWPLGQGGSVEANILFELRWPRALGAWWIGALLGWAGALGQSLFRNPLADPYLLGSASGAGLGVALGLLTLQGWVGLPMGWVHLGTTGLAFLGAWLAVLMALWLSGAWVKTTRLLLAGVVVGVVLSAATSALMLMVPQAWMTFQSFMLGTTQTLDWNAVIWLAVGGGVALIMVQPVVKTLDVLSLGESTALSLGLNLQQSRVILILSMTLATSLAVAHAGLIAFVGLAAPHLARSLIRAKPSESLWLSAWVGGLLMAAADLLSRWLWAPLEWPVGILTALLGGAYLLYRLGHLSKDSA